MISQTSSSPTARRNPYTCQNNIKLLHFFNFPSFFSSFPFQKCSPYKSLSAPAYERDGMPPFYQKFWTPFWRTPHLNNMPTSLSYTQSFSLTQLSMSSVPQSRWKTSPRTRRPRLENKEWNYLKTPILKNSWFWLQLYYARRMIPVWIKHVLGGLGRIPLLKWNHGVVQTLKIYICRQTLEKLQKNDSHLDCQRPPCSLMPGHFEGVCVSVW